MMRPTARPDGSALIVALWAVALLGLLVGSFAFDAHIEARITSYYRKRLKAEGLAKSGLEVAEMLMAKSAQGGLGDRPESEAAEDPWHGDAKRLEDGLGVQGLTHELGDGTLTVDIVPEPALRNVNLLKEEEWERIFEVGDIPEEYWPELVESFFDWTDKDDDPRVDGAETEDYYETLEKPYRAKNGALDTVEELLLVKGFSKAIVYGGVLKENEDDDDEDGVPVSGIHDLLTTYGDGKINVNAASMRVLMTLPDVDDIVAGAIIEEREGLTGLVGDEPEEVPFESAADFTGRMGLSGDVSRYISTDSKIFRVTSVGEVGGVTRRIWCIVEYVNGNMNILRWREES